MIAYLSLEGFLGFILFSSCLLFSFLDMERRGRFQGIHVAIIAMGMVYGLIFPLSIEGAREQVFSEANFILRAQDRSFVHPFAAFVAASCLYLGWRVASKSVFVRRFALFGRVTVGGLLRAAYLMFIIGFLSQYLYTLDYGGFLGYFEVNFRVRSGLLDESERSRFSYLLPFGGFAFLAFYILFGLRLAGNRGLAVKIGVFISGALSAYVSIASAGHVVMLSVFLVVVLSVLINSHVHRRILFFLTVSSGPIVIAIFYAISAMLGIKEAGDMVSYLVRETSFIFISFFANLEGGGGHLFRELLMAPLYLLPQSWTQPWLESATDINTRLIYGANKGEYGVTGAIPTDLLTFGLMQLHFIGVVLYAFLYGFLFKVLTCVASSFRHRGVAVVLLSYVYVKVGVFGLFYSYPKHILVGSFAMILTLLIFVVITSVGKMLAMVKHVNDGGAR